ncbi:MAG: hypothetical protein HY900_01110 [Deltaproteobacteria bacterium]|nr:hypothetical protein [Deltaproteobacteria bacterium]
MRQLALAVLLVFLGSALAVAYHHHGDGTPHRDCAACFHLQKTDGTGFVEPTAGAHVPALPVATLATFAELAPPTGIFCALPHARAPPA